MDEKDASFTQPVSAAERILDVMELMVGYPHGISLSDIAQRLSLPKSATHRLLTGLARRGYVQRAPGRDGYRLSMKIAAMGFRFVAQNGFLDICQPILQRLAVAVGELVLMTLFEDGELTFVAKAQGERRGLRYDTDLGWAVALHATATGRAWLMTLSDDEAVALVNTRGYSVTRRYGRQKVKNETDLVSELADARKRGYALSIDEGETGAAAVAVAVPDYLRERSPGTITVAGSMVRITGALDKIVPAINEAAAEIGALWPMLHERAMHGP